MNGLLLRLLDDKTGRPGFFFWRLFGAIRQDLDRLYWCLEGQPWMGPPAGYVEDETAFMSFDPGLGDFCLWRPGTLSRYAETFAEEYVELWALEPTRDDPKAIAELYAATPWEDVEAFIRTHARVWLIYNDSNCWEIYVREDGLLRQVRDELAGKTWLEIYESRDDRRGEAFRAAGL